MKSIGIEICENADGNFEKAVENAQRLIRQLMKEQSIPLANVVPHKRWSGKECPRKLLNRWDSFKAGIAVAHISKKPTVKPTKAEPSKTAASKPAKKSYGLPTGILKVTKPFTKGTGVKAIQEALAAVYYYPDKGAKSNGIDGYYGPKTANAVKRFRLMQGLAADGIYGPKTKVALKKALK